MRRKVIKFILIFLVILFICNIAICSTSQADNFGGLTVEGLTASAKDKSSAGNSILSFIQGLLVVIQVTATGVAVIMLIVLAIKYISSAPSEKADIKKSAMIYVVGAIILFAGSGILAIIRSFAEKNISAVD